MSAPKWTPGPWSFANGTLLRVSDTKAPQVVVCGVHRIGSQGGPARGDPLANGRLIAAAPELYGALEACIREFGALAHIYSDETCQRAYAALAKARGEP